ncbi:MAG: hypothetical protein HN350_19795 [Phycisphaerales bacterium]|jgi:hypothetical protein|nr:hypothetical protein [Phycisphaerales bacterium]
MVHPFERIIPSDETEKPSRRNVLKIAACGAVAAVAAKATGQVATTMAIGEEGGQPGRPIATTRAIGEEGGKGPVIVRPGHQGKLLTHYRNFQTALRAGDVETAGQEFTKMETAAKSEKKNSRYKRLVSNSRKQLDTALTTRLKHADANLKAKKLVPAIKTYRAISRIEGFKQQALAKGKLTEAAKLDGHAEALSEVQAQELYDTAAKAKNCDKVAIYEQTARDYPKTPTGKKAARQAKALSARLKREEAASAAMLKKARKAKGSSQVKMLQAIVRQYPDTTSGKLAREMLPKAPRPRPGGGMIATTMAIGEEG